jgi:hypothetical protein
MSNKLKLENVQAALIMSNGELKAACDILNSKYQTLYAFIKRYNLKFASKKPAICSKEQLEEAYARLGSLSLVAKELGGTKEGVRCAMKRYGLIINPLIIHTCDEDFFSRDNEESFYWAGFLAADGCIGKHSNYKTTNYLSLALAKKDKEHVELFKKHINTSAPVLEYLVKNSAYNSKWNDSWKNEIKITSEKICADLARFNIVPRKSLIYAFPDWLIQHSLVNHFMRGYFDGDGSFYITLGKNKITPQLCFSLRGTTEFLTVYRSILEKECQLEEKRKDIRINTGIGVLEYGGNGILKKVAQFLYKNSTIYLPRKFDKIKELLLTPYKKEQEQ